MTKDNVFQILKTAGQTDAQIQKACSQTSCIVELGGALGARWLLEGQIDRFGAQLTLSVKFWDIEQSQMIAIKTGKFRNLSTMAEKIEPLMSDLMSEIRIDLQLAFDAPETC